MSIDDDNWLEALAGRRPSGAAEPGSSSSIAVQEALALRESIRGQESTPPATVAVTDPAREQQLIERARAAGLIATPRGSRRIDTRIAWRIAAMLIVVVGAGVWRSMQPPAERLRGVVDGTIHIQARDPAALKRQLTEELTQAGVRVHGYERLGHLGLDAELPQPLSAAVSAVLERHRLPVPADGALVIEIDPVERQ